MSKDRMTLEDFARDILRPRISTLAGEIAKELQDFPIGPPATRWQRLKNRLVEKADRVRRAWMVLRGEDEQDD